MEIVNGTTLKLHAYATGHTDRWNVRPAVGFGRYEVMEIRIVNGRYECWGQYVLLGGVFGEKLIHIWSARLNDAPQHVQEQVREIMKQLRRN